MKYMLGANYWGLDHGTEMWLHYDGKKIREEFKTLSEYGIKILRVFPNWRDFQPVDKSYSWAGFGGEYVHSRTREPVTGDGVDMDRIAEFHDLCKAAEEYDIKLIVSIVTGWMSGMLYVPPVINGKNLISDHECLMWMRKYIHKFVKEMKNEKCIIMWDLGNESNCMGVAKNRAEAYHWTSTVADSIRAEDTTRPISSGMHAIESNPGSIQTSTAAWYIEDQGELTDYLTTHSYPSPTVEGDKEPYTRLRMTYLPTAQSLYYAGVSGKPAYLQETGTFSSITGSRKMAAEYMRIQILSTLVNGVDGLFWWCTWDQTHLNYEPYRWSLMERQLGIFDSNKNPKPVAHIMKEMHSVIQNLPSPFPRRKADGACILSFDQNRQNMAIASLILGKQAGIDLDVSHDLDGNIPDFDFYIMPSVSRWAVIYKQVWDALLEKVKSGATLCITFNNGHLVDLPEVIGAESEGLMTNISHSVKIGDEVLHYDGNEILLNPTTAEVLLKNEEGNPVLLKNKFGKGYIYFVNFNIEGVVLGQVDGFNKDPYYLIYKEVAKEIIDAKIVSTDDPNIGITINPESDNSLVVSILNYNDKPIVPDIKIKDGYKVKEVLYGNLNEIPGCNGTIIRLTK